MHSFLKALQDFSPLFQLITLIFLGIYVWKTWAMAKSTREAAEATELSLKEMKATREQLLQPYVICYFAQCKVPKLYALVIANIGATMAFEVKVTFDPPLEHFDRSLERYDLSQKCFAAFAPQQEWRTVWGSFIEEVNRKYPEHMGATISFRWGPARKLESYQVSLDISSLPNTLYPSEDSVEESLEKMQESLSKISDRFKE